VSDNGVAAYFGGGYHSVNTVRKIVYNDDSTSTLASTLTYGIGAGDGMANSAA
jgi:hypothetical protein